MHNTSFDRGRAVIGVAIFVATVAYFIALHALLVDRTWPLLTLAFVLAPWFVGAAGFVLNVARRASGPLRAAIGLGAVCVVGAVWWVTARFGNELAARADFVVFVENVAFFAWLTTLFSVTLLGRREPLITTMARRVRRGDMPPKLVRYTRQLTAAWACFFVTMILVACVLYFGVSRDAWSLFVNILIWPLVAAAFVVEYAIRRATLRDVRHESIFESVRAFRSRQEDAR